MEDFVEKKNEEIAEESGNDSSLDLGNDSEDSDSNSESNSDSKSEKNETEDNEPKDKRDDIQIRWQKLEKESDFEECKILDLDYQKREINYQFDYDHLSENIDPYDVLCIFIPETT